MESDLSPSAQAIVNAAVDVTGYGKETPLLKKRIAASLRTAALYCKRDDLILMSLADELEEE